MRKIIVYLIIIILFSWGACAAVDLENGLYAHYGFEEDPASSDLIDSVGGNDSTSDDVVGRVDGINNYGWNFSAGPDTVTMPTDLIDGWPSLTISCWSFLYTATRPQGAGAVWEGKRTAGSNQNSPVFTNTENIYYRITTSGGTTNTDSGVMNLLNKWSHTVVTYDGSNGMGWFDGVLRTNVSHTGTIDAGLSFKIGMYDVDGVIDECDFWGRALNKEEIEELWNGGSGTFYPFSGAATEGVYVNNNTVNFTSDGGQIIGYNGSEYLPTAETTDTTPSFTFTMAGTNNFVALTNESLNYTTLLTGEATYTNCTNTAGNDWACTFPESLATGTHDLYISAQDDNIDNNNWNYANQFNITIKDFTTDGYVIGEDGVGLPNSNLWVIDTATNASEILTIGQFGNYTYMPTAEKIYLFCAFDPTNYSAQPKAEWVNATSR